MSFNVGDHYRKAKISSTRVQLLQWLHGKQQQHNMQNLPLLMARVR